MYGLKQGFCQGQRSSQVNIRELVNLLWREWPVRDVALWWLTQAFLCQPENAFIHGRSVKSESERLAFSCHFEKSYGNRERDSQVLPSSLTITMYFRIGAPLYSYCSISRFHLEYRRFSMSGRMVCLRNIRKFCESFRKPLTSLRICVGDSRKPHRPSRFYLQRRSSWRIDCQ